MVSASMSASTRPSADTVSACPLTCTDPSTWPAIVSGSWAVTSPLMWMDGPICAAEVIVFLEECETAGKHRSGRSIVRPVKICALSPPRTTKNGAPLTDLSGRRQPADDVLNAAVVQHPVELGQVLFQHAAQLLLQRRNLLLELAVDLFRL